MPEATYSNIAIQCMNKCMNRCIELNLARLKELYSLTVCNSKFKVLVVPRVESILRSCSCWGCLAKCFLQHLGLKQPLRRTRSSWGMPLSTLPSWLWLKSMFQNSSLVSGTNDENLRNPSSLISSRTSAWGSVCTEHLRATSTQFSETLPHLGGEASHPVP